MDSQDSSRKPYAHSRKRIHEMNLYNHENTFKSKISECLDRTDTGDVSMPVENKSILSNSPNSIQSKKRMHDLKLYNHEETFKQNISSLFQRNEDNLIEVQNNMDGQNSTAKPNVHSRARIYEMGLYNHENTFQLKISHCLDCNNPDTSMLAENKSILSNLTNSLVDEKRIHNLKLYNHEGTFRQNVSSLLQRNEGLSNTQLDQENISILSEPHASDSSNLSILNKCNSILSNMSNSVQTEKRLHNLKLYNHEGTFKKTVSELFQENEESSNIQLDQENTDVQSEPYVLDSSKFENCDYFVIGTTQNSLGNTFVQNEPHASDSSKFENCEYSVIGISQSIPTTEDNSASINVKKTNSTSQSVHCALDQSFLSAVVNISENKHEERLETEKGPTNFDQTIFLEDIDQTLIQINDEPSSNSIPDSSVNSCMKKLKNATVLSMPIDEVSNVESSDIYYNKTYTIVGRNPSFFCETITETSQNLENKINSNHKSLNSLNPTQENSHIIVVQNNDSTNFTINDVAHEAVKRTTISSNLDFSNTIRCEKIGVINDSTIANIRISAAKMEDQTMSINEHVRSESKNPFVEPRSSFKMETSALCAVAEKTDFENILIDGTIKTDASDLIFSNDDESDILSVVDQKEVEVCNTPQSDCLNKHDQSTKKLSAKVDKSVTILPCEVVIENTTVEANQSMNIPLLPNFRSDPSQTNSESTISNRANFSNLQNAGISMIVPPINHSYAMPIKKAIIEKNTHFDTILDCEEFIEYDTNSSNLKAISQNSNQSNSVTAPSDFVDHESSFNSPSMPVINEDIHYSTIDKIDSICIDDDSAKTKALESFAENLESIQKLSAMMVEESATVEPLSPTTFVIEPITAGSCRSSKKLQESAAKKKIAKETLSYVSDVSTIPNNDELMNTMCDYSFRKINSQMTLPNASSMVDLSRIDDENTIVDLKPHVKKKATALCLDAEETDFGNILVDGAEKTNRSEFVISKIEKSVTFNIADRVEILSTSQSNSSNMYNQSNKLGPKVDKSVTILPCEVVIENTIVGANQTTNIPLPPNLCQVSSQTNSESIISNGTCSSNLKNDGISIIAPPINHSYAIPIKKANIEKTVHFDTVLECEETIEYDGNTSISKVTSQNLHTSSLSDFVNRELSCAPLSMSPISEDEVHYSTTNETAIDNVHSTYVDEDPDKTEAPESISENVGINQNSIVLSECPSSNIDNSVAVKHSSVATGFTQTSTTRLRRSSKRLQESAAKKKMANETANPVSDVSSVPNNNELTGTTRDYSFRRTRSQFTALEPSSMAAAPSAYKSTVSFKPGTETPESRTRKSFSASSQMTETFSVIDRMFDDGSDDNEDIFVKPTQRPPRKKPKKPKSSNFDLLETVKEKEPLPRKAKFPNIPPHIYQPFYEFLIKKMTPKYGIKTNKRVLDVAKQVAKTIELVIKEQDKTVYLPKIDELKMELAREQVVKTHYDFYLFAMKRTSPYFSAKAVPMLIPKGAVRQSAAFDPDKVFTNILPEEQ